MSEFYDIKTSCNKEDVISIDGKLDTLDSFDDKIHKALSNYGVGDALNSALKKELGSFSASGYQSFHYDQSCSILKTEGGGWKKGKVRFRYIAEIVLDEEEEVISSETESPLDDIRQSIAERQSES